MKDEAEKMGFAGLLSLASDVDETVSQPQRKHEITTLNKPGTQRSDSSTSGSTSSPRTQSRPASQPETVVVTSGSTQGAAAKKSSIAGWFWALGGVGLVVLLVIASEQKSSDSPPSIQKPPATPEPKKERVPRITKPPRMSAPKKPPVPTFTKPPAGEGRVLGISEIRWCLRERIRIDTLEKISTSQLGIERFNAMVSDYNTRCGRFQYKVGTLEGARKDVEDMRDRIVNEILSADNRQAGVNGRQLKPKEEDALNGEPLGESQRSLEAILVGFYNSKIGEKVRAHVQGSERFPSSAAVVYELTLFPGGDIVESRLIKSSGVPGYDVAVTAAIGAAQPLPVPPPGSPLFQQNFRKFRILVKPELACVLSRNQQSC